MYIEFIIISRVAKQQILLKIVHFVIKAPNISLEIELNDFIMVSHHNHCLQWCS